MLNYTEAYLPLLQCKTRIYNNIMEYTAVVDAPTGHVTLGANMANGIEQKGIDTLQQCIKKCASAGLGIPATVCIARKNLYYILIKFRGDRRLCTYAMCSKPMLLSFDINLLYLDFFKFVSKT